jgi:xanthine permease XanP
MAKKPSNLIYGVDESPGLAALLLLGVQHVCVLTIAFIFPVVIVDAIGGQPSEAGQLISMAMIATGVATILQGLNKGPVGSGYLCPLLNGPAFLSASLLAGKAGGLPLIFGMTAVGGVFEGLFSRVVPRMRAVFPAEVTGTIVTMVGIEIIPMAVKKFAGIDRLHADPSGLSVIVALITLTAMMGFNVWGKGKMRLYSVLLGMGVGYGTAFATGILSSEQWRELAGARFFAVPAFGHYGMTFDKALLIPFLVATLSSALKTTGDLTICQKINDSEWKRPDMRSVGKGILACSIGNVISGLAGGLGQSVSSSNVGLSIATGATSRKIAYAIGGILILLAFLPRVAGIFVIMPTPVMGASLVFAASFMILAGLQIIMSRMIDSRKTFVIGISIVFGLSAEFAPELYEHIPSWLEPFCSSSLSIATVSAVILNLFFRIGISKKANFSLRPGVDSSETVFAFMEKQGALWGALKDVVFRAAGVVNEFMESVAAQGFAKGSLGVSVTFDEFNLDVYIEYKGEMMSFPKERPSESELSGDEKRFFDLSGFLIRTRTDSIVTKEKDGLSRVHFHFDH